MKKIIKINFRSIENYLSTLGLNLSDLFGNRRLTKGALFFDQN